MFGLNTPASLFDLDHDQKRQQVKELYLQGLNSFFSEKIEDCLAIDTDGKPCIEIKTPLDIEASVFLPRGNIFQRELQWPFAESENEIGKWGVETDIANIFICGAGAKRGGGVALLLTNIRESGAPIKKIEGQSSGVIPVMKMLEDAFSYANQLGARQGAGAVYLNAHHPDILKFLDTKRENADEKVRIKSLSLGVVIPDITLDLARTNEDMYLFSPYDVEKVYGVPMSDISVTEKYQEMVDDARIRKSKINARKLFETIAELQFESGYPYIVYEDTVNRDNPIAGRINMSNLCSEILQVNTPTTYNEDLSYNQVGKDISCNLGSLNIAKTMDSPNFPLTVEAAIRALTAVSDLSNIASVTSIKDGNDKSHAIGLGQMNLHGYLARERIHYGSEEGVDFTNIYFYTILFHALTASNKIAKERNKTFVGFEKSKYASGEFFKKYIEKEWKPKTARVAQLFTESNIAIPTQDDWKALSEEIKYKEFALIFS